MLASVLQQGVEHNQSVSKNNEPGGGNQNTFLTCSLACLQYEQPLAKVQHQAGSTVTRSGTEACHSKQWLNLYKH